MLQELGDNTLKRYNRAWVKCLKFALKKPEFAGFKSVTDFDRVPVLGLALLLVQFARLESVPEARAAYAAFLLFPCFESLRFQACLRKLKREWNVSVPKYHMFYDVQRLVAKLCVQPVFSESEKMLQAILVMQLFELFRVIHLATCSRQLDRSTHPWSVFSRRKQKVKPQPYPVHRYDPAAVCPQRCLQSYLDATADYSGPELFVSCTHPRKPLTSDTINNLTTAWLKGNGMARFSARSTRGAGATALILLGADPHVVCALGDWASFDCFMKFYNNVRAHTSIAEVLVPYAVAQSSGSALCFR